MQKTNKGFTLVELLVVVAIIGLLAGIATVSVNSTRVKARDARRIADIKQMQNALELYNNANAGVYPTAGADIVMGSADAKTISSTGGIAKVGGGEVYLNVVPADPGTNAYTYKTCAAPCGSYKLQFKTEGTTSLGAGPADFCATPTGLAPGACP